jgi:hypothetical protein
MFSIALDSVTGRLSQDMKHFAKEAKVAGRIALNYGADRKAAPLMRQSVTDQVNLSKAYVKGRIGVSQRATNENLEARVTARTRATSLARFSIGASAVGQGPVTVQVKRGQSRKIRGGFLIRLRVGNQELGNVGLAIRLGVGEDVVGKKFTARAISGEQGKSRLYLLYGPSVQQLALSAAVGALDEVGDGMIAEYDRQIARILTA